MTDGEEMDIASLRCQKTNDRRESGKDGSVVLNENITVARSADVVWRIAPGHLVIGRVDGSVHEASGAAPKIWGHIDRPIRIGELITALAGRHAVEPDEIRDDVMSFLTELAADDLITTHA